MKYLKTYEDLILEKKQRKTPTEVVNRDKSILQDRLKKHKQRLQKIRTQKKEKTGGEEHLKELLELIEIQMLEREIRLIELKGEKNRLRRRLKEIKNS